MSADRHAIARAMDLDCAAETERIGGWMAQTVGRLGRRGVVIAVSGGVDSSTCVALAVRALGATRVFGLLLPERDSSGTSARLGRMVVEGLGIEHEVENITPALEAIGCYRRRDAAIRTLFPDYGPEWKSKIAIASGMGGRLHFFRLIVQDPAGAVHERRLPPKAYLEIVAATSFKQRIRKTLEYFHADRLNYAVVGTPNRLEYDQGFFVKNGDGSADLKPIAHLYKTQVYALARHLQLPEEVCAALPTTDTYSLAQGQEEFYFALPYAKMDLALWAHGQGFSAEDLAPSIGLNADQARAVYADIESKRRTTSYLHAAPRLVEPVQAISH